MSSAELLENFLQPEVHKASNMTFAVLRVRCEDDSAERVAFDVGWPDGRKFRYVLSQSGVQTEGFAPGADEFCSQRDVARIRLVECPAGTLTVLVERRGGLVARWRRWRRRRAGGGTGAFDDVAWGTSAEGHDIELLATILRQLGYVAEHTTWASVAVEPS